MIVNELGATVTHFLKSTSPVFFMGSRGPILPIVLFAEFSSEITAFVVFHLDEAFLFHLTIDRFTRFTTHVSPSSFEFGTQTLAQCLLGSLVFDDSTHQTGHTFGQGKSSGTSRLSLSGGLPPLSCRHGDE